MAHRPRFSLPLMAALLAAGCGSDPSPITADVHCQGPPVVSLAIGESTILDATQNQGCLELPAAGPAGATHLVVAYAGSGQITSGGTRGAYSLGTEEQATVTTAPSLARAAEPDPATRFHLMLRERERQLATQPARRLPRAVRPQVAPPTVGDQRNFQVCGDTDCSSFVTVTATAKFVGPRGAIYLDNTVPAGGLTQEDIDSLGSLFDGDAPNIYASDTTAFGRESDADQNGVVIILLTDAVNALSGNCPNNTIILGYFFGLDLVQDPHSNNGEIFYGLVPNPAATSCRVTRNQVFAQLPPVLAHEFQHMISFNQHALVRSGPSEVTWLNEGLSHLAEEIAGRNLPDTRCPLFTSCLVQFASGNLFNSYSYLLDPESQFLVFPSGSFGSLEERGASWLFVRWLADHFAADSVLGTQLTRALVQTAATGSANVSAVTGVAFDQLVGQWQMANVTEAIPGFTGASGRLYYRSWNLPSAYASVVGGSYPLSPDGVTDGSYARTGVLRGGSGRHLLVVQAPNSPPIDLQLKGDNHFASLLPRLAVVRTQ